MAVDFSGLYRATMSAFGEPATLRRIGEADREITVIPEDPRPEDSVPGQYLVRSIDESAGIAKGDRIMIDGATFDVFDLRQREGSSLVRAFLSKSNP